MAIYVPSGLCLRYLHPHPHLDIVVLHGLEGVEGFTGGGFVENVGVDGICDGVVGEFSEDQAAFAFIKELHHVCWDPIAIVNVWIIFDYLKSI